MRCVEVPKESRNEFSGSSDLTCLVLSTRARLSSVFTIWRLMALLI